MKYGKQHYIPESYLRAWCDPNTPTGQEPYIWIISPDGSNSRRKSPANIFYEQDFYTIKDAGGGRDLTLEHGLSELENCFATIRRNKLASHAGLDIYDRIILCAFTAAMHERTRASREKIREEWQPALETIQEWKEWLKTATSEEKQGLQSLGDYTGRALTTEDVEAIVKEPMQTVFMERVSILTRLFVRFDLGILETTTSLGFVTSDSPCVMDQSMVTLPISPLQVLVLNGQGFWGYGSTGDNLFVADGINRRTVSSAHEWFVARQPETRPEWFS